MRKVGFFAVLFVFSVVFSATAFAQAPAANTGNAKIVVINTAAFGDEKEGIAKFRNAYTTLNKEFQPMQTELEGMVKKYQTLETEITKLRQAPANPNVPATNAGATLRTKAEEYENLGIQIKRKQEDGKSKFERREGELLSPVLQDIGKAMEDFAKAKGYSLILDVSKLAQAGVVLVADDKVDVTKEFVTYYNARPGTTAVK